MQIKHQEEILKAVLLVRSEPILVPRNLISFMLQTQWKILARLERKISRLENINLIKVLYSKATEQKIISQKVKIWRRRGGSPIVPERDLGSQRQNIEISKTW